MLGAGDPLVEARRGPADRQNGVVIDLAAVRARFPALAAAGDDLPTVHADAPGGTQVVDTVLEAMRTYLVTSNANAHGTFAASRATDRTSERGRQELGRFTGCEPEGVVFGPNMTTLWFALARALDARVGHGDDVVCTRLDHDANVAPWLRLAERRGATVRFVALDGDGRLRVEELEELVGARTRLVCFPRASNALGTLVDPAPFVEAAHAVGALALMDAVHAAPHVRLDRTGDGVDALACSPYKFFGPHAGVLAADPALLEALAPEKVRPSPDAGPERWQTGTASFEDIAGATAAVEYVLSVGFDAITEHERELSQRFLDGLGELPHVTLHGPPTADDRTPTFAVTVDGAAPLAVAAHLGERGIAAWAGHYYAVEPMRALGLLDRGGAVRIGFVHYHGVEDVDRVLAALAELRAA